MSLSEDEQRALAAIEAATRASDPAFAAALTAPPADPARERKIRRFTYVWAACVTAVILVALATTDVPLAAVDPWLVLTLPIALSWYKRRLTRNSFGSPPR